MPEWPMTTVGHGSVARRHSEPPCSAQPRRGTTIGCPFQLLYQAIKWLQARKYRIFDNLELRSTGALINAEILARATRRGYAIVQVGVRHFPRTSGQQTGAKPGVIFRAFWELVKLYRQINSE